jgi:aspartyl-tRNA(Asn)/glutamyl-tRNA(Gln) amidotransferase subunit C
MDDPTIAMLAKLSRIALTADESQSIKKDLAKILKYVDELKEVDVEGITPCNHVIEGVTNVMRDDEVSETMPRETLLANAPDQIGGMIRVPPVMRGEES